MLAKALVLPFNFNRLLRCLQSFTNLIWNSKVTTTRMMTPTLSSFLSDVRKTSRVISLCHSIEVVWKQIGKAQRCYSSNLIERGKVESLLLDKSQTITGNLEQFETKLLASLQVGGSLGLWLGLGVLQVILLFPWDTIWLSFPYICTNIDTALQSWSTWGHVKLHCCVLDAFPGLLVLVLQVLQEAIKVVLPIVNRFGRCGENQKKG